MLSELIRDRAWATEKGTARFASHHGKGKADGAYRNVARMTLSGLGIGTYLGAADEPTDARYVESLVEAVKLGINVIDTASNYRDGRSEQCVGRALKELIDGRQIYRSEVLLASKAGFLSAATMDLADPAEIACRCHCMAPAYVAQVIDRSLAAMAVSTVDVYFLHNPECQLQELPKQQVLDRIRAAFEALETACNDGKIRVYGVATWSGLRAALTDKDHLAIEDLVGLAEDVAGKANRFKAIQVPLNSAMPEAHNLANQPVEGEHVSTLAAAAHFGLVSFASGSLYQGKLARKGRAVESLRRVMNAPGVTTALAGMSSIEHVRENIAAMA